MSDACGADRCVTCSDEASPMRVLTVELPALARCIDEHGVTFDVMVDLVGDVRPGDTVLVHAGTAIALTESPEPSR